MASNKRLITICRNLILILILLTLFSVRRAYGLQTLPTRTPKPDPVQPTAVPPDDNDDNDNGDEDGDDDDEKDESQPTSEPPADPSPTPIPDTAAPVITETPTPVVATATPVPHAGLCAFPPTYEAVAATSVHAGPGADYAQVGALAAAEVRQIIGRSATINWWLIQLDDSGGSGWVIDSSGIVHGFTGLVPIVQALGEDDAAPSTGDTTWAPTPDARCSDPSSFTIQMYWLPNPIWPIMAFNVEDDATKPYILLKEFRFEMIS